MSVTAVVLSANVYTHKFTDINVLVHQSVIRTSADLQRARFDAVARVTTPFFFFLDDDDDLPPDYRQVLNRCVLMNCPLVYTDEIVRAHGEPDEVFVKSEYSQRAHLRNALLVHHLVLCSTKHALAAVGRLPRGHYCPEFMLYWEIAKSGACYMPEVGYIWNKAKGMHTWPETTLSQMRAMLWCKTHPLI